MKWLAGVILAALIILSLSRNAAAELAYETVNDIQVPSGVLWGVQGEYQGHIVYEVKEEPTRYVVKIARDGEPHEYPYFYVAFTKQWEHISTTRNVNPEAERRAAEDAKRQAEEAQRQQQAEQDRIRAEQEAQRQREEEERNKPKPEPPVVKPPEEEPEPEEPEEPDEE